MINDALNKIRNLNDARLHPGCVTSDLEALAVRANVDLPGGHAEFLRASNGVMTFDGYVRLFGVGDAALIDSIQWNAEEYWKFAWDKRCHGFWCFGETAWGDQYAYDIEELRQKGTSGVHFLDCLSMTPEVISPDFESFLSQEFLRSAATPYDTMILKAREKFGRLDAKAHLAYSPSILLGSEESIDNVTIMEARAAMICNGDIAIQIDAGPANREIKAVKPYEDDLHRMRLELVWL